MIWGWTRGVYCISSALRLPRFLMLCAECGGVCDLNLLVTGAGGRAQDSAGTGQRGHGMARDSGRWMAWDSTGAGQQGLRTAWAQDSTGAGQHRSRTVRAQDGTGAGQHKCRTVRAWDSAGMGQHRCRTARPPDSTGAACLRGWRQENCQRACGGRSLCFSNGYNVPVYLYLLC